MPTPSGPQLTSGLELHVVAAEYCEIGLSTRASENWTANDMMVVSVVRGHVKLQGCITFDRFNRPRLDPCFCIVTQPGYHESIVWGITVY